MRAQMNNPGQPIATSPHIHPYSKLLQQIHDDLRLQHPEWVEPSGESPMCDFYEARLMDLLEANAKGLVHGADTTPRARAGGIRATPAASDGLTSRFHSQRDLDVTP